MELGPLNLAGDQQQDLRYHGGPDQAVYVYPVEHYPEWQRRLGVLELPPGSFGENLSVEGFQEADVHLGDVFEAGTAALQVTKPREPCYKMNVRFQRNDAVKLFAHAEWPGFYCRVLRTGTVAAGAPFRRVETDAKAPSIVSEFRRRLHRA